MARMPRDASCSAGRSRGRAADVLCLAASVPGSAGGLWCRPLSGPGDREARPHGTLDPARLCQTVREAAKERGSSRDPGCWDRASRDERPDEGGEEGLTSTTRVVDHLEEGEIGRQLLPRDA